MQNPRAHFVVNLGNDTFDVITGYKLNRDPLNLADANRLARRASASTISVVGQLSDEYDRRRRREMI